MITLLYAAILGLLSVLLANQVLYVRLRGGEEEKWRSNATERVQANFVENVPLALIILFIFVVPLFLMTIAFPGSNSLIIFCPTLKAV